ncbi:hypothetical protein P692DRAFT_201784464 [Suillus brevipes Sb2]|nr:hypothetical protein P692DRAFT_201784464 [Suillus brevipes Sb2]
MWTSNAQWALTDWKLVTPRTPQWNSPWVSQLLVLDWLDVAPIMRSFIIRLHCC